MKGEPPFDVVDGVSLSRATFDKRFQGPLQATSTVQMLAVRTPIETSAGYVAVERIVGTLEGRTGSFVVLHTGMVQRGAESLTLVVVPDSGTGALAGLLGRMEIQRTEGKHRYALEYAFQAAPEGADGAEDV